MAGAQEKSVASPAMAEVNIILMVCIISAAIYVSAIQTDCRLYGQLFLNSLTDKQVIVFNEWQ